MFPGILLFPSQFSGGQMVAYTTFFDISHTSFPWWYPAFGLVLGALGIAVLRRRKADDKWIYGIAAFSILWTLIAFSGISEGDSAFKTAYGSGNYLVVEGPVQGLWEGIQGKEECFSVQNKRFCYSDYVITPGFRNSAFNGGPIRADLPVRVSYVGDTIVKLEIRSDRAPSRSEIRIQKIEGLARQSFFFVAFGGAILAINGVMWVYDRLREKKLPTLQR
jgi:hypothetical protein